MRRWPSTRASPTTRICSSATGSGSPRSGRRRSSRSSESRSTATSSSIGGSTFAIFDLPTGQKLLGKEGELDAVQAAATEGTSAEELTQQIQSELGADYEVRTGVEEAEEQSSEIATFTTIIRYFLLSFAGIALFVGAFVIFNTLSITVAQRTREFATLRTLGASRRQVLRSVILEALVIGLGASIIGLFSGLALALGLNALFKSLNLDLPQTDTVFATRTIVVSLLVGTLVTLVAGLFPAIRATRVPPIAAVREGATLPRGRFAHFTPYIASLIVALAVVALAYGTLAGDIAVGDRFALLGVGVLALFIGVAMLSSRLVRPLAKAVGIPARRLGGAAGKLAERNAQRNPGRTAATAAALMIGIALVTFISVLANGLRVSNSDAIERQIQADLIVTSQDGYSEFPAAVGTAAAAAAGVEITSNVRQDIAQIDGDGANLTGLDDRVTEVYDFRWEDGSDAVLAQLGSDGAVLPSNVAEDRISRSATPSRCSRPAARRRPSSSGASTRAARSTRCSGRRASRRRRSTTSTSARATASRCSTPQPPRRPRSRASRVRSRASRTRGSRRARSGSTRRIRRSSSSCSCSTSCSPSP